MDRQIRRQSNPFTAMQSRAGSQRAPMPPPDTWTPPLKRSRTSLSAGSTRMYPSHSTPSGPSLGMPPAFSFETPFLGPVAEQPANAMTLFSGSQTLASGPTSYFAVDHLGAPVYDDCGLDPTDFLQARGYKQNRPLPATSFGTSSLLPSTAAAAAFGDPDRLQHHLAAPSLLSFDSSMTDAMTLDTNSSGQVRDPYDGSPSLPFQMVHSNSQSSFMESPVYESGINLFDKGSANDTDLRYAGFMYANNLPPVASAGLNADVSQTMPYMEKSMSTQSFATVDLAMPTMSQPFVNSLSQQQLTAEDMCRDLSNTSTRSTSSRAKESLLRHLGNGKTPLKPKALSDEVKSSSSSQSLSDVTTTTPDSTRMEVTRTRQEHRTKMPRLFCDLCTASSKGFRGEHELRRHKQNKHSSTPKRWICCNPRDNKTTSSYVPFQSLGNCRKCSDKRKYAQDYNAAEHLRRVHFTEKAQRKGCKTTSGRSKQGSHGNSKGQRTSEDQTMISMEELKKWMKEVDVPADTYAASAANDQDDSEHCGLDTPDNTGYNGSAASHAEGNTGESCYVISSDSACQSPRINPWNPKSSTGETLPDNYAWSYDVHSPSDTGELYDIVGCDELNKQSSAFPEEIDPSYFCLGC